jgi:hypothetical protein
MEPFNLMTGELAELALALENGANWGDIVLDSEERRLDQLREQLAEMVALQTPGRWRVGLEIMQMEVALPWRPAAAESVTQAEAEETLAAAEQALAEANAQEEEYEAWLAEQEELEAEERYVRLYGIGF